MPTASRRSKSKKPAAQKKKKNPRRHKPREEAAHDESDPYDYGEYSAEAPRRPRSAKRRRADDVPPQPPPPARSASRRQSQARNSGEHFPTRADYLAWRANASGVAANREASAARMVGALESEVIAHRERGKKRKRGGSGSESQTSVNPLAPTMPKGGRQIKTVLGYTLTEEDIDDQLELDDNCLAFVAGPPAEYVAIQNMLRVPPGGKGECFACTTGGPSVTAEQMASIARMWEDGTQFTEPGKLAQQVAMYYDQEVRIPANQVIRSKAVWQREDAAAAGRSVSSGDLEIPAQRSAAGIAAVAPLTDSNGGPLLRQGDEEPALQQEQLLPPWTAASVYEHFTEHVTDPELFVSDAIHELKTIKKHLFLRGIFNFNVRRPSEVRIKAKHLGMYLSVLDKMFKAYQLDTRALSLYRPGRSAATTRGGPRINPNRPRHSIAGASAGSNMLLKFLDRPATGAV